MQKVQDMVLPEVQMWWRRCRALEAAQGRCRWCRLPALHRLHLGKHNVRCWRVHAHGGAGTPQVRVKTQSRKLLTYLFSFGAGPLQDSLSLRILQETSCGQTLAARSTPAGLLLLPFSKPGGHGLAADLTNGGATGPPGIRI